MLLRNIYLNKKNTIFLLFVGLIGYSWPTHGELKWSCEPAADGRSWACGSSAPITSGPTAQAVTSTEAFAAREDQPIIRRPSAQVRQERTMSDYAYLDWYPKHAITQEQLEQTSPHCAGAYIEPPLLGGIEEPGQEPFYASAENSEYEGENIATFTGDARLRVGARRLSSDEARWYRDKNVAELKGNVRFREPGVLILSEYTRANIDSGEMTADDVEYVLHQSHVRGAAGHIERDKEGIVHIQDGTYTTCEPASNVWEMKGSEITLNQETGVGTAKHMRLKVKGVPVLYTPYIQFPIDNRRKSGLLMPTIGYSSDDGVDIATPYYLNLAPNYDATITPRYISKRGFMLESEFRYLSQHHEGFLGGAFLLDDDEYNDNRWLYGWGHNGTFMNQRLRAQVDYTRVSDEEYFSDLGTDLQLTSQTHLDQRGELQYRGNYWDLTTRVHGYQTIDRFVREEDRPYNRLPQVLFEGNYPHAGTGLEFLLDAEYVYFDRNTDKISDYVVDDLIFAVQNNTPLLITANNFDLVTGHRVHVEPGVSLPIEWAWGYVTPTVKLKHTRYYLDDTPDLDNILNDVLNNNFFDLFPEVDDEQSRTIPVASIDAGLFFERSTTLGNTPFTQTLEPRLYYLYVPYENQDGIPNFDTSELTFEYDQLFREDRFSGRDRVGDTHQVSLGLTTRFVDDETGREQFRASLGQIYYFDDRKVTLDGNPSDDLTDDMSDIVGEAVYRFNDALFIRGDFEWDPDDGEFDKGAARLQYQPDPDRIFNAGYRYRRNYLEQAEVSFVWPVPKSPNWSVIGRWHYGLDLDRTVESIAGLEYESCCWRVRVLYRRWLDDDDIADADVETDSGVFLQLQFRGLGGIGNRVDSILDDGITGYREREDYGHYK